MVERLNFWEGSNQISTLCEHGVDHYAEFAMRAIGFRLPMSFRQYRRVWPARVEKKLGIQVTLLRRQSG